MKQNLANRLAGGGFWAIQTALMCVEGVHEMRERGIPGPAVNLSDTQIFVSAALNAFNLFVNVNMDNVRMNVDVQVRPDVQFRNKYSQPITEEVWQGLQRDPDYKWIAKWQNGLENVYTVWTGVDGNGCQPPHIFATAVIRFIDGQKIRLSSE